VPPELEAYRERGHRRLAARAYEMKCSSCMWGATMPVEIIIDNWNPRGRNGMVYVEEDWVDQMAVEYRDPDE
jgi:hypothetical protein